MQNTISTGVEAFVAAWNARDPDGVAACYGPDGVRVQIAHPCAYVTGRDALRDHVAEIMAAWPDCTLEVRASSADGDVVTLEWTFRGTQRADYAGLPGRGQALELHGASVCLLDAGVIRRERVYWDTGTLMASAGVLPG